MKTKRVRKKSRSGRLRPEESSLLVLRLREMADGLTTTVYFGVVADLTGQIRDLVARICQDRHGADLAGGLCWSRWNSSPGLLKFGPGWPG